MADSDHLEMEPVASAPKVTFDDILATVGNFGRYQKFVVFLVILPMVLPSGFLSMSSVRKIVQYFTRFHAVGLRAALQGVSS